ncbi:RidA family protein [Mesorhizobium argentiipisi]|uniref:RidA family protein n=1 Tax=Mesorhizobium argentiipisi TaxID=3015175 RepID=A0ABU8KAR2_9HYPH
MLAIYSSRWIFAGLRDRGISLPSDIQSQGAYDLVVVNENIAYASGQLPRLNSSGEIVTGSLSTGSDLAEAQSAARLCLCRALLALHQELGDLSQVRRLVYMRGFIKSTPDFDRHGAVMDAASKLACDLFGEAGRHARSALGVSSLPGSGLVEIELTAALRRPF